MNIKYHLHLHLERPPMSPEMCVYYTVLLANFHLQFLNWSLWGYTEKDTMATNEIPLETKEYHKKWDQW
jgi:hypothetical protein